MPSGVHEITVYLQGYQTYHQRTFFRPARDYHFRAILEPLAAGAAQEPPPHPAPAEAVPARNPGAYPPPSGGEPRMAPQAPPRESHGFGTLALQVQPPDAT